MSQPLLSQFDIRRPQDPAESGGHQSGRERPHRVSDRTQTHILKPSITGRVGKRAQPIISVNTPRLARYMSGLGLYTTILPIAMKTIKFLETHKNVKLQ